MRKCLILLRSVQHVQPSNPFASRQEKLAGGPAPVPSGAPLLFFFIISSFKLDRLDGLYGEKDFFASNLFRDVGQGWTAGQFGCPALLGECKRAATPVVLRQL